jgi:hypothetical protein
LLNLLATLEAISSVIATSDAAALCPAKVSVVPVPMDLKFNQYFCSVPASPSPYS